MMCVIYISCVFTLKTRVYLIGHSLINVNYFRISSRLCKKMLQIADYCMFIVCHIDDLFRQGTLFVVL